MALRMPTDVERILDRMEDKRRKAIADELERIEEGAMYSSQSQFEQAKLWRGTNLILGVPAAALAGVAGATALASTTGRVAAGILALCAAGFGAVMTTLNAARRAEQAHIASNAYLALRNDARRLRTIDLPGLPLDDGRQALIRLYLASEATCGRPSCDGLSPRTLRLTPPAVSAPRVSGRRHEEA